MIFELLDSDTALQSALKHGLNAIQYKKYDSYVVGNIAEFEDYKNQEDLVKAVIEDTYKEV